MNRALLTVTAIALAISRAWGAQVLATTDDHGSISPAGLVTVDDGGSTSFVITAGTDYLVGQILTNGAEYPVASETGTVQVVWSNLSGQATIHARFRAALATNGAPQWWLREYGWTNDFDAWSLLDFDTDGLPTWQEYFAKTSPTDDTSRLTFVSEGQTGETMNIGWLCANDCFYRVERSADLLTDAFTNVIARHAPADPNGTVTLADTSASGRVAAYRVSVENTGWTQFTGWAVGFATNGYGTILHTDDGGFTWVRQGWPGEIADVGISGVEAVDAETAWAVGDTADGYPTIYKTTNGGLAWARQGSSAQLSTSDLFKVSAVNAQVAWAVGPHGRVVCTTNGGAQWTNCSPGGFEDISLQGVVALDAQTAWASGGLMDGAAVVLKTVNGGGDWVRQTNGIMETHVNHLIGLCAVDSQNVWAVGGGGEYVLNSTNGGDAWTVKYHGPPKDANWVYAIDATNVWVALDSVVIHTTDAGDTWDSFTTTDYTMGITVIGPNVWASVQSGGYKIGLIYHTTDNGAHWDQQGIPNQILAELSNISMVER